MASVFQFRRTHPDRHSNVIVLVATVFAVHEDVVAKGQFERNGHFFLEVSVTRLLDRRFQIRVGVDLQCVAARLLTDDRYED